MKWDRAAEWIAWRMSARRACITEMHVRADEEPVSSEAACETALFIGNLSIEAMRERARWGL